MNPWDEFLQTYHARHPGITEDLLLPMRARVAGAAGAEGAAGCPAVAQQPYEWLLDGLPDTGLVWDVCCGSASASPWP